MNTHSTQHLVMLATTMLALAACNSNEPKPKTDPAPTSVSSTEYVKPAEPAPQPKPAPEVKNPTVISFEKMSVGLDNKAKETIAEVVTRAKSSRKVAVTGYCDKSQVANPADAAVARAVAVRDELIRLGVPPATIQVKFVTKLANKHIAEIHFD